MDNCRGMSVMELQRLVERVGESSKKGVSWLNGRFGFGVHSFRAAAEALVVRTKQRGSDMFEMRLQRDQMKGIAAPVRVANTLPSDHGTEILLIKYVISFLFFLFALKAT